MGLTKDYLKFIPNGVCNVVGSADGVVQAIDNVTCAVTACENVNFFNMRTLEKTFEISLLENKVTTFKVNSNRSLVAVGYHSGEVRLYNRTKGKEPAIFTGHRIGVNAFAFSDDGSMLASGGKDSVIIIWDIVNESGMFRLNGHKGTITQLQFTVDNKNLISSSKDFQVKFWNIASQSCFYTIVECMSEVYTFGLLKSDRLLVLGSADVELLVFELTWLDRVSEEDDQLVSNDQPLASAPKKICKEELKPLVGAEAIDEENSQGNKIICCKKRGTLLRQAQGRTRQISISHDEAFLCCVASDYVMDIFRVYTAEESRKRFSKKLSQERRKREQKEIDDSLENTIAKDVTLLLARVAGFTANAKFRWIDFCGNTKRLKDDITEYKLYCLFNNNDVQGVVLRFGNKNVSCESIVSLGQRGHRSDVTSLSFASNDSAFLSGSTELAILWDFNTLLPKNHLVDDQMKHITASMFSPSDQEAILCTKDGNIFIFDLAECELVEHLKNAHDNSITAIVSLPMKTGFMTVGLDKKAKFWHYEFTQDFDKKRLTVKLDRVLELQDDILCAAISPNGKFVVFGLLDNTARIHYLDSLRFFISLYGHSLPIFSVDISPDNKLVATGSGDKTAKIWGLDFGDCHKSFFAHDEAVSFVKFGADKEEILFWTAGKDGKLKQWDAIKFRQIQRLNGHTEEIRALCSSSDGRVIVSGSHDKSIRLWELSDEIINLQEEEEKQLEKEYEEKLLDAEDIVPGEALDQEAEMASIKSIDSIKSTESILECIDLFRTEKLSQETNPEHKPHILLVKYNSDQLDFFVLDVLQKVRSSHLEKSLLMVPLSYVPDILKCLCKCVQQNYRIEFCSRVILFLIKIHHTQIINSLELLPIIDELRTTLPAKISSNLDQVGFNLAALRFFQMNLEERNNVKLFRFSIEKEKGSKKSKKKSKKVKDTATIKV